jgi:hypothetical protein
MEASTAGLEAALHKSRSIERARAAGITNFYPLYDEAHDQVDSVLKIQPVRFQRILPRYRLSTSDTRNQGTGPMFDEIPSFAPVGTDTPKIHPLMRSRWQVPKDSSVGQRVDLFA